MSCLRPSTARHAIEPASADIAFHFRSGVLDRAAVRQHGKDVLGIATQFKRYSGRRDRNKRLGARKTSSGAPLSTVLTKSFPQEKPAEAKAALGKKRVVIVGGGFAGIAAARALKRSDVDILLLDRRNHHIFQPLLYQVATAVLAPSEIAAPLRQLEAKQKNVQVLLAEVKGVNPAARSIEVTCPGVGSRKFEYDFLVVATGMHPSYFGHDEFAPFAPGLKNLSDAEMIRTRILSAFELAESTDNEKERARQMTFVLVGGGPTGVELAASIAQMVSVTLRRNFRNI